jgi:hypothetical protein
LDSEKLIGIFSLLASVSVATVTAFFDLLKRRDDRKHQAGSHWRKLGAGAVGNLQIFVDDPPPQDVLEHPWLGETPA